MAKSKAVADRAKASETRIGTAVVSTTLGATRSRKLAKAIERVAATQEASPEKRGESPYLVLADSQGEGYLRVAFKGKGSLFLRNTGEKIELVELDAATIKSRNLTPVPEASILESAKILARPLTSGVIISERCKPYLDRILNDKEIINMATAKKAASKKAKTAAPKSKAAKTSNGHVGRKPLDLTAVITLKKGPKEDSIKRHVDFLTTLKEVGKGKMTLGELAKAFAKRVKSKQDPVKVFGMHRKALVDGGFITVSE